jgi:transcriptional regulator with XRE-family HTH domain
MGRASQALKQVLEAYDISQNSLAVAMGVKRGSVNRWFHDKRDPTAETVVEVVKALNSMNSDAAKRFIELYLCEAIAEDQTDG